MLPSAATKPRFCILGSRASGFVPIARAGVSWTFGAAAYKDETPPANVARAITQYRIFRPICTGYAPKAGQKVNQICIFFILNDYVLCYFGQIVWLVISIAGVMSHNTLLWNSFALPHPTPQFVSAEYPSTPAKHHAKNRRTPNSCLKGQIYAGTHRLQSS